MQQSLARLLELQEIDRAVDELEACRSEYPTEIDLLEQEIEAAARSLTKLQEEIHEQERKRRHSEGVLELANADLQKHQQQLYKIRTNKEYDALQIEIEECKRRIAASENEILQAMSSLEELTVKVQEGKQAFAETEREKKGRVAELTEKLGSIEDRMKVHRNQRAIVAEGVKKRVLDAYERIRKAKKATVVTVLRGACGGCYKRIPPQKLIEIRRNEQLISCENCGRILVWDDRSS